MIRLICLQSKVKSYVVFAIKSDQRLRTQFMPNQYLKDLHQRVLAGVPVRNNIEELGTHAGVKRSLH
jgi:hypothetical protein